MIIYYSSPVLWVGWTLLGYSSAPCGVDWSYRDHDVLLARGCQDGLHTQLAFDVGLPVQAMNWNILVFFHVVSHVAGLLCDRMVPRMF